MTTIIMKQVKSKTNERVETKFDQPILQLGDNKFARSEHKRTYIMGTVGPVGFQEHSDQNIKLHNHPTSAEYSHNIIDPSKFDYSAQKHEDGSRKIPRE
jgi:hypothetical protein